MSTINQVVPASPGTMAVVAYGRGVPVFETVAVVAWVLEMRGDDDVYAKPVLGHPELNAGCVDWTIGIVQPDGSVIESCGDWHPTVEAFKAALTNGDAS